MVFCEIFRVRVFRLWMRLSDPIERLSIETSHPVWLVKRWVNQFGYEKTKEMCEINLTAPLQTARVNLTKTSVDECIENLDEEGFQIEKSPIIPEAIRSLKGKSSFFKSI